MEEYVEFSGKDVDDAIANACKHFGIERDKLEIEIVSGGSSGIFGLVGVKKARILAQKRAVIEESKPAKKTEDSALTDAPAPKTQAEPVNAKPQPKPAPKQQKSEQEQKQKLEPGSQHKPEPMPKPPRPMPVNKTAPKQEPEPVSVQESKPVSVQESRPAAKMESGPEPELNSTFEIETGEKEKIGTEKMETLDIPPDTPADDPELREYIHGLLVHLTEPLSPNADITVNDQTRPISVIIKDETTSEILIGRDGQTLSAIQYIANRIIAKNRPGAARVQLDTEDFLEKQSEKLQENAFQLATKAKKIGKTMSTRPLSSYHRRIVHMALQNDKKIRTKSKGDGPMKRVLIMPKQRRKKPSQE